tara:strand:+ start:325 stop:795 length:471 start_codon:yes stop_codon:yes gene_type:complete
MDDSYSLYKGLRFYRCGKVEREWKNKGWCLVENTGNRTDGYNTITIGGKPYLRHRLMMAAWNPLFNIKNKEYCVDHIDGDRLNNSFENLRAVTHQGNSFNNHCARGYTLDKRYNKYQAKIFANGRIRGLGLYETEEEARAAYLAGKEKFHVIQVQC